AGPGETFVAQLLTVCAPASSLTVWSAPLVNEGASFRESTLMEKVCSVDVSIPPLAVPPSSLSDIVTVVPPLALAAGVSACVPFELMAGGLENKPGFSFTTVKLRVRPDSLAGPGEILVAQFSIV